MAISTYAELIAAVQSWLHRSDLSAQAQNFVALGEAHLNRALRCPDMEAVAIVTAGTSDRYAALPSRFLEPLSLDHLGESLQHMTSAETARASLTAGAGFPCAYAVTSRIEFDRVPDQVYALTLSYVQSLDLHADGSNWLLTRHPDAYLFAALVESAPFIRDDDRLGLWMTRRDAAVREAGSSEMRRRPAVLRTDIPISASAFNVNTGA